MDICVSVHINIAHKYRLGHDGLTTFDIVPLKSLSFKTVMPYITIYRDRHLNGGFVINVIIRRGQKAKHFICS